MTCSSQKKLGTLVSKRFRLDSKRRRISSSVGLLGREAHNADETPNNATSEMTADDVLEIMGIEPLASCIIFNQRS